MPFVIIESIGRDIQDVAVRNNREVAYAFALDTIRKKEKAFDEEVVSKTLAEHGIYVFEEKVEAHSDQELTSVEVWDVSEEKEVVGSEQIPFRGAGPGGRLLGNEPSGVDDLDT